MDRIETTELDAHRSQIIADVNGLVDKHRAIFDWDIAEIDQDLADRLILETIRKALDDIEQALAEGKPKAT